MMLIYNGFEIEILTDPESNQTTAFIDEIDGFNRFQFTIDNLDIAEQLAISFIDKFLKLENKSPSS
jgi:hypothetical protein